MNYVLIDKKQLDEKQLFPFAELLPDGRAILPLNALKTVTGLTGIDIVDGEQVKLLQAAAPPVPPAIIDPINPPADVNTPMDAPADVEIENTNNQIEKEISNE